MSEATTVGRNDACPCGSGKKYQKCCMNTHRVQREAAKSAREPHQLIAEDTSVWQMFKLLETAAESSLPKFLWESGHDAGPWRQQYPEATAYFAALGSGAETMIARPGTELLRIRHDGVDAQLLLMRNNTVEVVTLRPNECDANGARRAVQYWGWRVWSVDRHEVERGVEPTFEALGYEWSPAPPPVVKKKRATVDAPEEE